MCLRSQQQRRDDVCVINDYADIVSAYIVNEYADTCQRSQHLRGHRVNVVNDYADTREIIYFGKSNNKCNMIFSKIACPRSRWLRRHFQKNLKASHLF